MINLSNWSMRISIILMIPMYLFIVYDAPKMWLKILVAAWLPFTILGLVTSVIIQSRALKAVKYRPEDEI